jgi:hypothetical protein
MKQLHAPVFGVQGKTPLQNFPWDNPDSESPARTELSTQGSFGELDNCVPKNLSRPGGVLTPANWGAKELDNYCPGPYSG